MSSVVGIDLSSRCLDLVKLDETTNAAEWVRCDLAGANAWERTLAIREAMWAATGDSLHRWFEDVYLVAIEAPYGRGQPGTNAILNRVVGAVCASLPARLRAPERCWLVAPHEYRTPYGLRGKPTDDDLERLCSDLRVYGREGTTDEAWANGRDATLLAFWARSVNADAVTRGAA